MRNTECTVICGFLAQQQRMCVRWLNSTKGMQLIIVSASPSSWYTLGVHVMYTYLVQRTRANHTSLLVNGEVQSLDDGVDWKKGSWPRHDTCIGIPPPSFSLWAASSETGTHSAPSQTWSQLNVASLLHSCYSESHGMCPSVVVHDKHTHTHTEGIHCMTCKCC